jgi:hypothetical protein
MLVKNERNYLPIFFINFQLSKLALECQETIELWTVGRLYHKYLMPQLTMVEDKQALLLPEMTANVPRTVF